LKTTIADIDGLKKFEVGDRVEMVEGQYKGMKGLVTAIVNEKLGKS
jgi:transcription antitermination factor NusG